MSRYPNTPSNSEDTLVRAEAVSYSYQGADGSVPVLRNIHLHLRRGEFAAVLGASGSGKSTLLNLVGGLEKPTSGTIHVNGLEVSRLSNREAEAYLQREVAFVFQFFNLLPTLTALENILLGLEASDRTTPSDLDRALHYLDAVGLDGKRNRYPAHLSGGEQQRVAIARALAKDAPLILADEPTGSLDENTADTIMNLFVRVQRESKATLLLITHDPGVSSRADRVLRLTNGCFTASEATEAARATS